METRAPVWSVSTAEHPQLRAVEALAVVSRLVVNGQFILDLIFIFGIVRVYFGTARVVIRGRDVPSVDEAS